MRQIQYVPSHTGLSDEVFMCDIGMMLHVGEVVSVTEQQAEIAFTNRNIVDAQTGKNPYYVCAVGDHICYDTLFSQDLKIHKMTEDGKFRVCREYYETGICPYEKKSQTATPGVLEVVSEVIQEEKPAEHTPSVPVTFEEEEFHA